MSNGAQIFKDLRADLGLPDLPLKNIFTWTLFAPPLSTCLPTWCMWGTLLLLALMVTSSISAQPRKYSSVLDTPEPCRKQQVRNEKALCPYAFSCYPTLAMRDVEGSSASANRIELACSKVHSLSGIWRKYDL
jgi:hypothetical protein